MHPPDADHHPSLTTDRLVLRRLDPADAPSLFAIHADPDAMRYWSTPAWTDRATATRMIDDDRLAATDGSAYRFGLFDGAGFGNAGLLVGCCSLFRIDRVNGRAELGYILRRSHWGRGLMHEAAAAVVTFAFDTLGLRRIEADLDPNNATSAAMVVRLGFEREALMRERWLVGGVVSDSAIYGLLRDDWRRRRSESESESG